MKIRPVKNEQISAAILIALLLLLGITFVGSWIGSAAGWPLRSLLSAEGLRWLFARAPGLTARSGVVMLWLLLTAWGALSYVGLPAVLGALFCRRPVSQRQRHAFGMSAAVLAAWAGLLVMWGVPPHGVLLSATGRLWPSPLVNGLLPAIAVGLIAVALCYGLLGNTISTRREMIRLFSHGVSGHAQWLWLYVVASFLWVCVRYILGFD
ncbi:MAG: AbgT family transporter [Clostridium sp.]|nr:AbgT family transporter [Clostridium sp.]